MASKETINLEIKLNTAIERKLGKLARLTGKLDFDVKSINSGIQKLNFALQTTSTLLGELSMSLGQVAARSQMAFNTRGLSSYNNLLRQATTNARNLSLRPSSIPLSLTSGSRYVQNNRYLPAMRSRGGGSSLVDAGDILTYNALRSIPTSVTKKIRPKKLPAHFRDYSIDNLSRYIPSNIRKDAKRLGMSPFDRYSGHIQHKFIEQNYDGKSATDPVANKEMMRRLRPRGDKQATENLKKAQTRSRLNWRAANRYSQTTLQAVGGGGPIGRLVGFMNNPYLLATVGVGALAGKAIHEAGRKQFRTQQLRNIFGKNQGSLVMEGITQFANVTPFTNAFLADQVQQLGAVGFGRQSALKKMRTLGEFSYGDTNRFKSIMSAYTKMVSKGRLDAEIRNQFLETGKIDPLQIIAKSTESLLDPETGRNIETYSERLKEVTRMFHAGEIGASLLINAMDGVAGTMTGLKESSQTLEGQLSTAQGQFNEAMAELGTNLLPVATKALKRLNDSLGFFLGQENAFDFFNKFGFGSYADLRRMPEDLRKKTIKSKLSTMSDRELDYAQDKAASLGMKKRKLRSPTAFSLLTGYTLFDPTRTAFSLDQLTEAVNQDVMKDPDTISGDSTSKDKLNALEKGITSGGARQKYITINIDTVKSADSISIENADDTDQVQDNFTTAFFKAISYAGEMGTA